MSGHPLYIVDVFAESKYAGNQLAVVANADDLSEEEMQAIAFEMNFSETTFVKSGGSPAEGYDVRIFLPTRETPFAGHPTLGTAYIIKTEVDRTCEGPVVLNLGIGKVPVRFESDDAGEIVWMQPPTPEFGPTHRAEEIVDMLGLYVEDVDERFPVQEVSTGIPFLFVPLKTLDALKTSGFSLDLRPEFMTEGPLPVFPFLFCPETRDPANHFSARMYFEAGGVREDPATGSANTCFAAYLVKHRYLSSDSIDVRVEQGYDMGRPSLLRLKATDRSGEMEIAVGGRVVLVARGELA